MPRVVAFDDVKALQNTVRGRTRTDFFSANDSAPDEPMAYLHQGDGGRVTRTHWHATDQFQVIVEGSGKLGKHEVAPYTVQFVRAHTPYGPVVGDTLTGVSYISTLPSYDPQAHYLPESRAKLQQVPDRKPWQVIRSIKFPSQSGRAVSAVEFREIPDVIDPHGLHAWTLAMAPYARTVTPDPSRSKGQYVIVVKGSLRYREKDHRAYTVIFIEPKHGRFSLEAGAQGLEAFVVNFPHSNSGALAAAPKKPVAGHKMWQCELCAFVYDESLGMPEDGIAAGTRWEDVPESWTCADCSASKSDFHMVPV